MSDGTYAWPRLLALDGDALFDHCRHTLEKNAQDLTSDAGQYVTPRALIQAAP